MLLEKVGLLVFVSNRHCFDRHMPRSSGKLLNKEKFHKKYNELYICVNYSPNTFKKRGNPDTKDSQLKYHFSRSKKKKKPNQLTLTSITIFKIYIK